MLETEEGIFMKKTKTNKQKKQKQYTKGTEMSEESECLSVQTCSVHRDQCQLR